MIFFVLKLCAKNAAKLCWALKTYVVLFSEFCVNLKLHLSATFQQHFSHGFILETFELVPFEVTLDVYTTVYPQGSHRWEMQCIELHDVKG